MSVNGSSGESSVELVEGAAGSGAGKSHPLGIVWEEGEVFLIPDADALDPGDRQGSGPESSVPLSAFDSALNTMKPSKATRSEVENWMDRKEAYLEELPEPEPGPVQDELGNVKLGNGEPELDISVSLSTLHVTVNTNIDGEADFEDDMTGKRPKRYTDD